MNATASVAPLVKHATVPCPPPRAFELFTEQISAWWPMATHSVGGSPACRVDMAGHVGGHIIETLPDGTTSIWGTITAWEPPSRVAFTWHPGRDLDEATEVQVVFEPTAQRHQQRPSRLPRRPRTLPTVGWKSLLLRALARSTTAFGTRGSVRRVHHRPASPGGGS